MMTLPDRQKAWQYVHSFRHSTSIVGQTDGQTNWYNNIVLCMLTRDTVMGLTV